MLRRSVVGGSGARRGGPPPPRLAFWAPVPSPQPPSPSLPCGRCPAGGYLANIRRLLQTSAIQTRAQKENYYRLLRRLLQTAARVVWWGSGLFWGVGLWSLLRAVSGLAGGWWVPRAQPPPRCAFASALCASSVSLRSPSSMRRRAARSLLSGLAGNGATAPPPTCSPGLACWGRCFFGGSFEVRGLGFRAFWCGRASRVDGACAVDPWCSTYRHVSCLPRFLSSPNARIMPICYARRVNLWRIHYHTRTLAECTAIESHGISFKGDFLIWFGGCQAEQTPAE